MSNKEYGKRILAVGEEVSNDTRISGLNNNDLIIGTAGTGKTGGYVIPAIQYIDGSLVVSDTKGQLEQRFKSILKAKGYKVAVIDFVDPQRSCGYNPLSFIRRNKDGSIREQDILTLANLICPDPSKDEPIWNMCAVGYIAFLIGYCLEACDKEDQNLKTILELRKAFSMPNGDLPFLEWIEKNPDKLAAKKYYEITANRNADKMWASIEGFVTSHLEVFNCKEMENIFARTKGFDINSLGKQKTVLFINQSDTDRAFDKVVNILNTQILQTLCSQADHNKENMLKVPVRLILDDFASGSKIPDFDKVISVIRSRDISVSIIIQSMTQLESMYDHSTSLTIMNNCDHILYLGGQDRETAEYIAFRACCTPETVACMPRDKAYLISSGDKARLVKKITPYSTCDDYQAGI